MAKILLIEDDSDQREMYRALLYYNGFDVLLAEDARQGIRLAVEQTPDVIVVDVMLPEVNGLVATQRLVDNPVTANIPIICMSAYDVSPQMILHSGAREFLPKPVDPSNLMKAIWRYVGAQNHEANPPSNGH